jgi:6-phosphogluconolactonase (cycloisomerase 2 family)
MLGSWGLRGSPVIVAVGIAACGCGQPGASDRSGRTFAYVIDGYALATTKRSLRVFELASDGALTETAASPAELAARPHNLRGNASGDRLYVTSRETAMLYAYAIDPETGALAELGAVATGRVPEMVALGPGGRWIYVPDLDTAGELHGFALDDQGVPSPIAGSPWPAPGPRPSWIEVHPNGRWAYVVAGSFPSRVYHYFISGDGALLPRATQSWSTQDGHSSAALIEAGGRYGFISPQTPGGIPGFTIDEASGALSTTPGSKFGSDANVAEHAALDRTRSLLFVANSGNNTLSGYSIDPDTGGLTDVVGSPVTIDGVWAVATSPSSDHVYVTTRTSSPAILHLSAAAAGMIVRGEYDFPGLDAAGRLTLAHTP